MNDDSFFDEDASLAEYVPESVDVFVESATHITESQQPAAAGVQTSLTPTI